MSFLENVGTGIAMGLSFGLMTQMMPRMGFGGGMWGFGPSIFSYGGWFGGGGMGAHHHHHHHCHHSFWC